MHLVDLDAFRIEAGYPWRSYRHCQCLLQETGGVARESSGGTRPMAVPR